MFPTDGERLLASTASEAAIRQRHVVQCGSCGASRSRHIDQRWSGASKRDRRHSRPVVRAWPGGSCKAIHDTEFGVGYSYHVVGSARAFLRLGVVLPEMEYCSFQPSWLGHAGGRGQSERPIWVTTQRFGVPLRPTLRGL